MRQSMDLLYSIIAVPFSQVSQNRAFLKDFSKSLLFAAWLYRSQLSLAMYSTSQSLIYAFAAVEGK